MKRRALGLVVPAVFLVACGEEATGPLTEAPAVPLVDTGGNRIGSVRGGDSQDGATLLVEASGLPQGIHGIHIHDVGRCEPPGFESAGGHWNPTTAHHGFQDPAGPHAGDLRNIVVGGDGQISQRIVVPGSYLITDNGRGGRQILDANGAALVIHAEADDYRTDPSGNSGARIACAVLGSGVGVGAPGTAATEPPVEENAMDANAVAPADANATAPADGNAAAPADGNAATNAS